MDPVFEKAAFDLQKKEDLSPIILSSFGYHIIKLTDDTHAKEWNDKICNEYIKQAKGVELNKMITGSLDKLKETSEFKMHYKAAN